MKRMKDFFVKNENETRKIATCLAEAIMESGQRQKKTMIIGLEGELGSGKTCFTKAFAKGLGIKKRLTSPTFVLMKKYKNLYHIDCYRIKNYKDILALDFKEIISNPKNIVIIEWAERIKKILPKDTLWIHFKIISEKERRVIIPN